jgi:hypothetical protein
MQRVSARAERIANPANRTSDLAELIRDFSPTGRDGQTTGFSRRFLSNPLIFRGHFLLGQEKSAAISIVRLGLLISRSQVRALYHQPIFSSTYRA